MNAIDALFQIDRLCRMAADEKPDEAILRGLIADVRWVIDQTRQPERATHA